MTAPRRTHGKLQSEWDKMCLSKVRFPDENVARARISQLYDQGVIDKPKLWVYHCPNCRGWHMTSKGHKEPRLRYHPVKPGDIYADDEPRRDRVTLRYNAGDAAVAKCKSAYKSTAKKVSPAQKFTPQGPKGKSFTSKK